MKMHAGSVPEVFDLLAANLDPKVNSSVAGRHASFYYKSRPRKLS